MADPLATEAARRRTFAIISHPDAGKTTLTEKLLLYSGSIHLAGSVRARRATRHAVSDWMKMEQERGISITSSVLQFDYEGSRLNLLDTPGHADFSEDTYRTLAAVDSAVMLMDHTKGVESRTRKLFEVCRMRKLPVVTFMNKLDRAGLDPLALVDEVGETLNLKVVPMNWPVGMGRDFKGVVDIATGKVSLFSGGKHGSERVVTEVRDSLADCADLLTPSLLEEVSEQLELVQIAGEPWDLDAYLRGELSPLFWGSAMSNFGVEPLLQFLAEHAAPPAPRVALRVDGAERNLEPSEDDFSGFVFKIQANMNPRHRDRVAFIRVVSGRFERGMDVMLGRTNAKLRMAKPHSFMAQERSIVEEAWPGDIVGLYDPGKLRIGDTVCASEALRFGGIPRFAPEFFGRMALEDPLKRKQLDQGLQQLSYEGVIQTFYRPEIGRQDAWLGAVGMLQFEVLKERLKNEYRVDARLETLKYSLARWIGGAPEGLEWLQRRRDYRVVEDRNGQPVLLAESNWAIDYALREAKGLELFEVEPL
ncbi:MAG: peptide chain release factor 3 [Deltaproteobacteria bacterium]|nr:peptide chain release factor 3 [Deltaproteobacteria bacterium]